MFTIANNILSISSFNPWQIASRFCRYEFEGKKTFSRFPLFILPLVFFMPHACSYKKNGKETRFLLRRSVSYYQTRLIRATICREIAANRSLIKILLAFTRLLKLSAHKFKYEAGRSFPIRGVDKKF